MGLFFDPPYGVEDRDTNIYHHDDTSVFKNVMDWCAERGKRDSYRIVLAGYEEYTPLLTIGWKSFHWTAGLGYGSPDNENRKRETLYFSPHCISINALDDLFGEKILKIPEAK